MKIGIEASAIVRHGKTGISYYLVNLFDALFQLPSDHTYYLVYITLIGRSDEAPGYNYRHVFKRRIPILPNRVYSKLHKMYLSPPFDLLAGLRTDLFIWPNYVSWRHWFSKTNILFVHDTAFLDTPQYLPAKSLLNLTKRVPKSITKADHIMTISEHSKQRLMHHFKLRGSQVSVATPAVDREFYKPQPPAVVGKVKRRYKISGDYLFYMGTLEPRKNIIGIVKAYQALPAKLRARYQLVLGGARGWIDQTVDDAILANPKGIIITGYIKHTDAPALYSGAAIFLYPSHFEGWGMQILEAMATGTPVITARNSSLPEAAGDAVLYVDPHNHNQISKTIERLLNDRALRQQLIKAGNSQVKKFSWHQSAQVLLDQINRLVSL